MIKPKPKNQDGVELSKTMHQDTVLLFTTFENKKIAAILVNGVLRKVYVKENGLPVGTVCLGKVSEIKEEIGSAFLLLANKQKCFVKLSELSGKFNLTRPGQNVKCGDSFVIKITKEPHKSKLASGTTKLKEEELFLRTVGETRTDFSVLKYGDSYVNRSVLFFKSLTDRVNQGNENTSGFRFRIITDDDELYRLLDGPDSVLRKNGTDSDCPSPYCFDLLKYEDSLVKLNVLYGLNGKIKEALGRHVWLKSGADLYIDYTEACTVIDVNSGKSSKKEDRDTHFLSLNKEAAEEISRQVLLRNLSGIILIDFINMKEASDRTELIGYMKELCNSNDPQMHVVDITKLGIMETTRQKTGPSLYEQFDS